MFSERLESPQLSNTDELVSSRASMSEKSNGCHVSTLAGFFLLLLGLILAVGVGILVHFAGPKPRCPDRCPGPSVHNGGDSRNWNRNDMEQWDSCKALSAAKNECKYM